jgi:radical SAM enzyme (TIGR01210 family)
MTNSTKRSTSDQEDVSYQPIYSGIRTFLGLKDLVVSFYSRKCQFKCTYCNLSYKSSPELISFEGIKQQIDWVFNKYSDKLDGFQQLSVGNEGSIIDSTRFPKEALNYLLERSHDLPALQVLALETRPEYISQKTIEEITGLTHAPAIDVTIGFETQDDHIREVVLKKSIHRKRFESSVKLLGELGVRLTCYILLKPAPTMTEREGILEAIASIEYLAELSQKHGVELIIYLNPTYAAEETPLAEEFIKHQYKPVRIQSVLEVILHAFHLNIPIYTGLWMESNAKMGGDYTSHIDYQPKIREMIKQYNKTQDGALLRPYLESAERNDESTSRTISPELSHGELA